MCASMRRLSVSPRMPQFQSPQSAFRGKSQGVRAIGACSKRDNQKFFGCAVSDRILTASFAFQAVRIAADSAISRMNGGDAVSGRADRRGGRAIVACSKRDNRKFFGCAVFDRILTASAAFQAVRIAAASAISRINGGATASCGIDRWGSGLFGRLCGVIGGFSLCVRRAKTLWQ